MKPAILFDIDGTLLYAKGIGRLAFAEAFAEAYGVEADCSQISFVGATDTAIVRELAQQYHVTSTPAKEEHFGLVLTTRLDERLRKPGAIAVYPGIPAFLKNLKDSGFELGIVTGNLRTTAWSKLIHAGLAEFFSFGSYASDHHDRDVLAQIACQRAADIGVTARLLIGDTPRDVRAAHAAGLPCLAFENGWVPHDAFVRAGTEALYSDFTDSASLMATVEMLCK